MGQFFKSQDNLKNAILQWFNTELPKKNSTADMKIIMLMNQLMAQFGQNNLFSLQQETEKYNMMIYKIMKSITSEWAKKAEFKEFASFIFRFVASSFGTEM